MARASPYLATTTRQTSNTLGDFGFSMTAQQALQSALHLGKAVGFDHVNGHSTIAGTLAQVGMAAAIPTCASVPAMVLCPFT